jgi:deoxyribose-phosphate aldolase
MTADPAREVAELAEREPARLIDHTLLRPDAGASDIDRLCDEAIEYHFAAVCVHGRWAGRARRRLTGTDVRLALVIDFPFGSGGARVKRDAARAAWDEGADELDVVFDRGAFLGGEELSAVKEIETLCRELPRGGLIKVILETAAFPDDDTKREAARLIVAAGAEYLKTSTGYGPGGARESDVRLLREVAGWNRGVKASGGIGDRESYRAMIRAGACRIGASAGVSIAKGIEG